MEDASGEQQDVRLSVFSRFPERSLFIRDLPFSCTSHDLKRFVVEQTELPVLRAIVCDNKQQKTLHFGYILLNSEEEIPIAIERLNGKRFIGRDIKAQAFRSNVSLETANTGVIHVGFRGLKLNMPLITEEVLRIYLESYGVIDQIVIRNLLYTKDGNQCGFAFVSFADMNVNKHVVESVRQVKVNLIVYQFSWSRYHVLTAPTDNHHSTEASTATTTTNTSSKKDSKGLKYLSTRVVSTENNSINNQPSFNNIWHNHSYNQPQFPQTSAVPPSYPVVFYPNQPTQQLPHNLSMQKQQVQHNMPFVYPPPSVSFPPPPPPPPLSLPVPAATMNHSSPYYSQQQSVISPNQYNHTTMLPSIPQPPQHNQQQQQQQQQQVYQQYQQPGYSSFNPQQYPSTVQHEMQHISIPASISTTMHSTQPSVSSSSPLAASTLPSPVYYAHLSTAAAAADATALVSAEPVGTYSSDASNIRNPSTVNHNVSSSPLTMNNVQETRNIPPLQQVPNMTYYHLPQQTIYAPPHMSYVVQQFPPPTPIDGAEAPVSPYHQTNHHQHYSNHPNSHFQQIQHSSNNTQNYSSSNVPYMGAMSVPVSQLSVYARHPAALTTPYVPISPLAHNYTASTTDKQSS